MSRRMVWALAGAGVAAVMVGGAVSQGTTPASSSQSLSSETSSSAPAGASAALSTADNSPASTAAAATTSAAVAPVIALTCPGAGTSAAPTFGHQITATAPYTVAIDYGDGGRYSNNDQHLSAIFAHKYRTPGTFTVGAVLTDATGQSTSATCAYSWAAPASVRASVPAPQSSTAGSGTGNSYVNVDGNTIHSPVTASSAPPGATAKCKDGTWSSSQNHSGTCSHHGGVAQWL